MLEVTTRTGTIYVLTNGRMERLPISPFGSHGPVIYGDPFTLKAPLSIGAPLKAFVFGMGNILTTPITSIVEYWNDGTTYHRDDDTASQRSIEDPIAATMRREGVSEREAILRHSP